METDDNKEEETKENKEAAPVNPYDVIINNMCVCLVNNVFMAMVGFQSQ